MLDNTWFVALSAEPLWIQALIYGASFWAIVYLVTLPFREPELKYYLGILASLMLGVIVIIVTCFPIGFLILWLIGAV